MENSKRTVKIISHTDHFTLITAIVIQIAFREKIRRRHDLLQRTTNKQLKAEVYHAVVKKHKCEISDIVE